MAFTMHVYPLFLIAAAYAAVWLVHAVWHLPGVRQRCRRPGSGLSVQLWSP